MDNTIIHDFEWKENGVKARGVFAQEAINVNPTAVSVGEDELNEEGFPIRPWCVDYSKYVPDIIVYCQQLNKTVQDLSAKLEAAEARIAALEGAK